MLQILRLFFLALILSLAGSAIADDSALGEKQTLAKMVSQEPEQILGSFASLWDEQKWVESFRGMAYMRAGDDSGWKIRMAALQALVAKGKESVLALESALNSEHVPTRILAAQALGFLAGNANPEVLERVAKADSDPASRLYAVDALGMSGNGPKVDWEQFNSERNRDVRMHLQYAQLRKAAAIEPDVVDKLVNWDIALADTAEVGKTAPEFELQTIEGETVRLSDFRGSQPVVLVFIYGDT